MVAPGRSRMRLASLTQAASCVRAKVETSSAKRASGCELRGHVRRQLVQLLDGDHHALWFAATRREVVQLHVVTGALEILHLRRQDIELTGTLDAGVAADDKATELVILALGPGEIGARDLDDCYCNRLPSNRGTVV
jgi:hypothetical protein